MPEQEWEPTPVPRHNVTCGVQFEDGTLCREPAGPDHHHLTLADAIVSKVFQDYAESIRFDEDVEPPEAFTREPAPGLAEAIAAGVPSWAEMRAKYPPLPWRKVDPEALRAKLPAPRAKWADLLGVPSGVAAAASAAMGNAIRAAAEAEQEQRRAEVLGATDQGEVDFRHMLKDDAAAWSAKARIEKVLGRPYLATQLADQLAPDTAAALADRLESLVSQAVAETETRLSAETSRLVSEKIAEIRATRTSPAEAVSRERFNTPSRFS